MTGSYEPSRKPQSSTLANIVFFVRDPELYQQIAACCVQCRIRALRFPLSGEETPSCLIVECSALEAEPLLPLDNARRRFPTTPIVVVARHSSEQLVVSALRTGVRDYLRWPTTTDELRTALVRAGVALNADEELSTPLVGADGSLSPVTDAIKRLGGADTTVLITGETGTGKELVAQALHRSSARRQLPFISVNCAAIPDALLESELFGYERGAFTGAETRRAGKLHLAHRGTLFLDEVGDMSLHSQAKVLRAVETKAIVPLGGSTEVSVDVRIIAATNKDLTELSAAGAFRSDLLFRLRVVELRLPPLRDRQGDIVPLTRYFIDHFSRKFGRSITTLTDHATAALLGYRWPGNVRELKNAVEVACLNAVGRVLDVADFPPLVRADVCSDDERVRLCEALHATHWNLSKVAERLQWSRTTVYRKIARYNLSRPQPTGDL
jgi:DNA-binding NtrC family response regulator